LPPEPFRKAFQLNSVAENRFPKHLDRHSVASSRFPKRLDLDSVPPGGHHAT